jgi:hypothetical protein
MPMTMIEVEPQPRIDTLVRLPGGGEARRTEYVGTAWFDGKPVVAGLGITRPPYARRGIRMPTFEAAFFVPDSLPYSRAALGDAKLSVSVLLGGSGGESNAILAAAAVFTGDPSGFANLDSGARSRSPGLACGRRIPGRRADAARCGSVGHKRPRRLVNRTLQLMKEVVPA